ncbi:MAG: amylo-alpha-1,6-glucosidase [Armatimonadetes bacterium]|nr:amylo-alpha-1,6-glucosidase [Armatimonadota bacterium]
MFPVIEVAKECLHELSQAIRLEWLETNGLGGYASCSIVGANTRRYHGLLIAALNPPRQRMILLAKLSETLWLNGAEYQLDTNLYHPNAVHPEGYRLLESFELSPFPTMRFVIGDATLIKQIIMPHLRNSVIVSYKLHAHVEAMLRVRIFLNARDHHHITRYDGSWLKEADLKFSERCIRVKLRWYAPPLIISFTSGRFIESRDWYYNFRYPIETERGLEDAEDLPTIGYIDARLAQSEPLYITASIGDLNADDAEAIIKGELQRRARLLNTIPCREVQDSVSELAQALSLNRDEQIGTDEIERLSKLLLTRLWLSSDSFIVRRPGSSSSVIAGYHWFSDWGRDAMISLPGLTLITGRYQVARELLTLFGEHMDCGIVPNFFPEDGGAPAYNTIDASLWFAHASYSYLRHTRDIKFVRSFLYERLRHLTQWHIAGTHFGIRVQDDGLLSWRSEGMAITWMDAKVGGTPVTPRQGKPVEVNALWLHCLWLVMRLAEMLGDMPTKRYIGYLHRRATESFHNRFWNGMVGCLYDVISEDAFDPSVRPNQLIALMLPSLKFDERRAHSILQVAIERLLTPIGLRTLAPNEPRYVGRYIGEQVARDAAYHNGTVWAWLLGPMCTGYARYNGRSVAARLTIAKWLCGMLKHLSEAGIGYISEIADGEAPHMPRGCIAQAWSVAEVLRSLIEDVFNIRKPKLWDEDD